MGTIIPPVVSEKNQYWIPRHRYYELKHFCLQYPVWKKAYESLNALSARPYDLAAVRKSGISDPTAKCAESMAFYSTRMDMLKDAARETDEAIGEHILHGVTENLAYDILEARFGVPCCRAEYYRLYRKFFWILDKKRG